MRLLSYSIDGDHGFGLLTADGEGVIDLGRRLDADDLGALIAREGLDAARPFLDEPADHAIADVVFERLLPSPGKIFCIGVNYGGRAAEYADKTDAAYPSVFPRFPDSFTAHEQPLVRPPESPQLDYEGEIVVVIGPHPDGNVGRRIPMADARSHIAGVSLGNEGTIRDWVRHAKFNVTQGKNWPNTGSMGPWLVPFTDAAQLDDVALTTHVNGELRQDDRTGRMLFPIRRQIEYISTFTTLVPGDIIVTGTPTGAGARFDPPKFLKPGDEIVVEAQGIGRLVNGVVDG